MTTHRRQHWGVESEPVGAAPTTVVERRSADETRRDAKRLLWRDSAIILVGVVLAVLVVNYLPGMIPGLVPSETESPFYGGPASLAPGSSPAPGATLGPVVDPGLGIGATPRPVPGVTLPPTGSFAPGDPGATPSPRPTRKPHASTPPATLPPTEAPTPEVTPEVTPPPPPPTVSVACQVTAPLTVTCDATVSNIEAGSQVWAMGGDGATISGGNGSSSITWAYLEAGQYTVTLTVTGDDGSSAGDSEQVDVPAL